MVSLQQEASLSHNRKERKVICPNLEAFSSSKKRKRQEDQGMQLQGDDDHHQEIISKSCKEPKLWNKSDVELHLDAPLPPEWQRCLDIKSGQIHFYNTRTHKRTSKDPRSTIPEPLPPSLNPSLDLELNLNLACSPSLARHGDERINSECEKNSSSRSSSCSSPSWASFDNVDRQEMVAVVCLRCHMLVMMCKASLSCPNCKFVHPEKNSSSFWLNDDNKPAGFRLLCCKD